MKPFILPIINSIKMNARFLEIEITGKCGYKCKHCYGNFPQNGELDFVKVCEIVHESRGLFDCLIFSGGEPFLHPRLAEMVELASKDFLVFITTSGCHLSQKQLARMKNRAVLVFGLDGIGNTHDFYRGVPGAFQNLLRSMEMTRKAPKEIIVTLWKGVIPQIDEIISLAKKYNAIVHFNGIIPVGRAKNNPAIFPAVQELERVYEKLYQLKASGSSVVTDLHKLNARDREAGIDLFCRGRFNITPQGNVRPCEFHPAALGNIYERSFKSIIMLAYKHNTIVRQREQGFKDQIRLDVQNPFDYHTQVCHLIPSTS